MSEQSKLDQAIGHGANMDAAGEGGWPCGTMLLVGVVAFVCFVVLPVVMGF